MTRRTGRAKTILVTIIGLFTTAAGAQEPTEAEMEQALRRDLESSVTQVKEATARVCDTANDRDSAMAGLGGLGCLTGMAVDTAKEMDILPVLSDFNKTACAPAAGQTGYNCDYEYTAQVLGIPFPAQQGSARFVPDPQRGGWIVLDVR